MFTIQRASNKQCDSSKFARTKRTIYVGLTLKECIAMLPKEIEQYILEYLDSHNIFAMDRATATQLRNALYYNLNTTHVTMRPKVTRAKISQMDKRQMVECAQLHVPNIQHLIYKTIFIEVLSRLKMHIIMLARKAIMARRKERYIILINAHIVQIKAEMRIGSLLHVNDTYHGIVTAMRENTVTIYPVASEFTFNGEYVSMILTGKRKAISYKYCLVVYLDVVYSVLSLRYNDKTVSLAPEERENIEIITQRIKSILA